ncbi:hypothetical protein HMI55_001571 [Coelomomyces lativittatus]|nr:hypothetical protein HMI55_001571 [Coelomomyces lativittatus]
MSTPPSTSQTSKDVHLSGLTPSPPTRPVRSSKRRSPGSGGAGVLGLTPGDDGSRAFTSATIPVSDQALLSFYGLTTLEPTVWFDLDPVLPQTPSTSSLQPSSPSSIPKSSSSSSLIHPPSNGGATSTTPMTPSSSSSSSTLNEGLDPLGFKANIFQHLSPSHLTPHRAQLSIVSKDFQPRLFLALVHPNLTYSQFQEGLKKLGNQGEQHHAWLRTLVRENFYPHVVAKTTVDTVFQTMTTQQDLHVDFAVPFMETLDIGVTTAQQVFGPMLLKRKHMESLKATLLVLDRFKFFFKLPNVLHLAVQQGHVESAVREFKKGKALVLAMYPSLVLSTTNASANASASANPPTSTSTSGSMSNSGGGGGVLDEVKSEHHKKLFEKIWTRVTHVMQLVKEQLIKQLHEHECALEIQEQAIRLILEVDPNADPFWTYLESRHRWILAQLKEKVSMHFRAITNNDTNDQQPLVKFTPNQFRKALFLRNKKEFETIFGMELVSFIIFISF